MFSGLSKTFDAMMRLQDAMDRAMNDNYFGISTTRGGTHPGVNFFEKDNSLMVTAELPGVRKEDLNIELKKDLLRISGERQVDYGEGVSIHRMERGADRFDRTLKLPYTVDADKINATFTDGILSITLPRHASEEPKRISISQ